MDGGNLRFANVPDSEILTIREYARPENTKKALNFGLKLFKGRKKSYLCSTFEQFQDMPLEITDFINLSRPVRQVALHPALTEMNTEGFNGRSIVCARLTSIQFSSCHHGPVQTMYFRFDQTSTTLTFSFSFQVKFKLDLTTRLFCKQTADLDC